MALLEPRLSDALFRASMHRIETHSTVVIMPPVIAFGLSPQCLLRSLLSQGLVSPSSTATV